MGFKPDDKGNVKTMGKEATVNNIKGVKDRKPIYKKNKPRDL